MLAAAEGRLAEHAAPRFSDRNAMTVVIAAEGYPAAPQKGSTITGIDTAEEAGARVFQAGTAEQDGKLVATGGRVPSVPATGETLNEALDAASARVDKIAFPDGSCRRAIRRRHVVRQG